LQRDIRAIRQDRRYSRSSKYLTGRRDSCGDIARGEQGVAVRRELVDGERDLLGAAGLGQGESIALVQRQTAAEVRQREGRLTVAAIGRADKLEQGLVLRDRQHLALAEHPADRGEIAGEHANLANTGLSHLRGS